MMMRERDGHAKCQTCGRYIKRGEGDTVLPHQEPRPQIGGDPYDYDQKRKLCVPMCPGGREPRQW